MPDESRQQPRLVDARLAQPVRQLTDALGRVLGKRSFEQSSNESVADSVDELVFAGHVVVDRGR